MFRSSLFNYPKGIWRFKLIDNREPMCEYISPKFVENLGYDLSKFLKSPFDYFLERLYPEDKKRIFAGLKEPKGRPVEKDMEFRIFDAWGNIHWLYVKSLPVAGKISGEIDISGFVIDITEEKREKERRKRRKEYLESFLKIARILLEEEDSAVLMKKILKILGEVTHADRTYWFRRFKRGKKWYLSQVNEWIREGVKPEIDNPRLQNIPEDKGFTFYHRELLKGGIVHALVKDLSEFDKNFLEPQDIKVILNIPLYTHSTFLGVLGFDNVHSEKLWDDEEVSALRLITDMIAIALLRYEREKEIRELVTRLRVLMETIPDLIVFKDPKGNWLYANNKVLHLFGLLDIDYEGKSDTELSNYVHPKLKPMFLEIMETERGEDKIYILKNGTKTYYIRPEKISITDQKDDIAGNLIIGNDITNEVRIQKERISLLEREAHLNRMESLGILAGGIAHRFNNELSVIMGNLSLLRAKIGENEFINYINRSISAAENMSSLIKRMLLFVGDGFHGEEDIEVEKEVNEVIEDFIEETHYRGVMNVEFSDTPMYIRMSKFEFREVLLNLLANANESMESLPEKEIDVRVFRKSNVNIFCIFHPLNMNPNRKYCIIEVKDHGKGMTEEVLEHAFDPFYSTKFIGRGLGLSTLIGIMDIHGGGIDIETGKKGTTFSIYLPLKRGDYYEDMEPEIRRRKENS